MTTEFTARFLRDLDKINQKSVKNDVRATIEQIEAASTQSEIKNIKKLRGHHTAYRIRNGDYRIGVLLKITLLNLFGLHIEKIFIGYFHNKSLIANP
jgi:mRNA interferase RelE/StbE